MLYNHTGLLFCHGEKEYLSLLLSKTACCDELETCAILVAFGSPDFLLYADDGCLFVGKPGGGAAFYT